MTLPPILPAVNCKEKKGNRKAIRKKDRPKQGHKRYVVSETGKAKKG